MVHNSTQPRFPYRMMQPWSSQKLTWKRKNLGNACNPVDAYLWMPHLWKELNGSNDQLTFEDIIELDTHEHFGRAGQSDTNLGELVELNLSDTYISELDKLSDTSLELNELSDIENGAGLVSGRNWPFSAQRKIHNKFNLGRFCTKFDQTFSQFISSPFSSSIPRGSQQGSLSRAWEK